MSAGTRLSLATLGFRGEAGGGGTTIVEKVSISVSLGATVGQVYDMAKDACGREVHNFCFTRGDNPTVTIDLVETGTTTPIDLTGATAKLTVHTTEYPVDATTEVFELTGVVQSPATDGTVHFQPTKPQANQTPGTYYYDIQVEFPDGTRRTFAIGEWEYDPSDLSDPGAS